MSGLLYCNILRSNPTASSYVYHDSLNT